MAETKTARDLWAECQNLKDSWSDRDKKMKKWYELLKQLDEFAQDGMESFVTNEPRTFYNLALHLLSEGIPHRIPVDTLTPANRPDASKLEKVIKVGWQHVDKQYRKSGRKSFLRRLIGLMLATGWYSVFTYIDETGFYADAWNPVQVYPEWDEERLVKCVRIYSLSKEAAKRKVKAKKWKYNKLITGDVTIANYFYIDDNDKVTNTVMIDGEFAKPPEVDGDFTDIPIFISPVGGLPDMGELDDKWKESVGESVLATNEVMYKQYNKQWTFASQLMRDTAQPRWFERSREGNILKPEEIFKRGAIFRGGPEDSIEALQVPPLPIELRTDRFDIQNMIQRGSLPWALYGNLQQSMAGYLMSQIASAAQQILKAYKDSISEVLSDIDNFWVEQMRDHHYNPYKLVIPAIIPEYTFSSEFQLKIPGDLVQRATVAKMVSPDFHVDTTTAADLFFPEIDDMTRVQAEARKDSALNSEIAVTIDMIAAFKSQAEQLKKLGDTYHAGLYDKAASMLEQQITPQNKQAAMPAQPQMPARQPLNQTGAQPRTQIPEELM